MNPTPATQLPTIREGTTLGFRFTVAQWSAIIGSLIGGLVVLVGFSIWLNTMHVDVQALKDSQVQQAGALQRIERSLSEIEFRQRYGITTSLPPAASARP